MDFLFLSKLLPLFIYPIGLVCLLLLTALIINWKRPKWTYIPVMLAFLILFTSSNSWSSSFLVKSLEWKYLYDGELPHAEAIVVLGGGGKSFNDVKLLINFGEKIDRVVYAGKLYHQDKAPLIIATGGKIEWLQRTISEADEMAMILEEMSVPSEAIIKETSALNTYENAVNVNKILKKLQINDILLVTSALHMPRAMMVFKHQGINAIPASTNFLFLPNDDWQSSLQANLLKFIPNIDTLSQTTKAIKEYIGIFIYKLKGWI